MAISRESNSKVDPSLNPEQLKKLQDKIEKCKQDVLKVNLGHLYVSRAPASPAHIPGTRGAFVAAGLMGGWRPTPTRHIPALRKVAR